MKWNWSRQVGNVINFVKYKRLMLIRWWNLFVVKHGIFLSTTTECCIIQSEIHWTFILFVWEIAWNWNKKKCLSYLRKGSDTAISISFMYTGIWFFISRPVSRLKSSSHFYVNSFPQLYTWIKGIWIHQMDMYFEVYRYSFEFVEL